MKQYVMRNYASIIAEHKCDMLRMTHDKEAIMAECNKALRSGVLDVWAENYIIDLMLDVENNLI